jgi:opacity protein-like surface antigen
MSLKLTAAVFAVIACPAVSFAQVVTPRVPDESRAAGAASAPKQSTGGRWEIEGHGGLSRGTAPSSGDAALPPPGLPIPSLSPLFPSRSTASWFFGDGAAMLNSVNEEFGLQNRITPLDTALASLGLDYSSAAAFGVRLRRMLTDRVSAEASFDVLPGSGDVSGEFLDAVDATRASFEPAFAALFSTGPLDAVAITAASREASGSSREVALTGAINMHFGTGGGFVPYVTFGGGILSGLGDLPSVTLDGDYQFAIVPASGPSVPIHETDQVTLRFEHSTVFVGLAGGGLRKQMSDRWGFRIDGRVLISPANSRLLIDATPEVTTGAPADFIETATNPNIQFSNNPATGRQSSLSGPPLDGFTAFKATGVQTRVLFTVGVFVRF